MKVLLAVDGSDCSALAVDHCLSTTWDDDTEIKVFSVVDPGTQLYAPKMAEMMTVRAEGLVHGYSEKLRERHPSIQISSNIGLGYESETIVKECDKWKSDLVILGSHGEGGGRLWLGSVSTSVLNHAHCAVRIIRCERANVRTNGDTVIVAIDHSDCSKVVVERICKYSWPANTKFILCSVIPDFSAILTLDPSGASAVPLREKKQKDAEQLMSDAASKLIEALSDPIIEMKTPAGNVKEHILALVKSTDCDAIYLGSHSRGFLTRAILGSVSEAVATHANCTVEVVRG